MGRGLLLLIGLMMLSGGESWGKTPQLPNCTIWIHTQDLRGVRKEKVLYTRSSSKTSCRNLASLHRPVFSRGQLRAKRVQFRYAEVPWGRQNFPSLD